MGPQQTDMVSGRSDVLPKPTVDDGDCPHGEPRNSGIICPACDHEHAGPKRRRRSSRPRPPRDVNPFDDQLRHGQRSSAKFAGRCICTVPTINVGDDIAYDLTIDRWVHAMCCPDRP
jgi:hypothetical protein